MELEKKNVIFLIGNGYDLGNGLQTSYKSFIIWYLKDCLKKALENGTNKYGDNCINIVVTNHYSNPTRHDECASKLGDIIDANTLNKLIVHNLPDPGYQNFDIAIKPINDFVNRILLDCTNSEWSGIEHEIYKVISAAHHNIKVSHNSSDPKTSSAYPKNLKTIESLNKSVLHLKSKLKEYLITQNRAEYDRSYWFDRVLDKPENENKKIDYHFLNFNYTTYYTTTIQTLRSRYGSESVNFNTLNIHGTLGSPIEEIVFGIGDEQNDFYHQIESLYGDEWLQCMKSFHYFRNNKYQKLLGIIESGNFEIYVMGHSCSITDRTLLNMVFEHQNCKKIHICHYNGIESYLRTTYNIARNFQDKVKMRQVVMPYDQHLTM